MQWAEVLGEGVTPYPHQEQTAQALLAGQSVILRAPTGSGKTEAICGPFLHAREPEALLPGSMIYSLPMRVLASQLRDRVGAWAAGHRVSCQHGQDPGSALFAADITFATIDQTIGSFVTCPPSLPLKLGNIPAGAVAQALLAFDEIQLLDPRRALQAMAVILSHRRPLDLPFVAASATFPDNLVEWIADLGDDVRVVEAEADQLIATGRAQRTVRVCTAPDGLPYDQIVQRAREGTGNIAVICNTVARAQETYRLLRPEFPDRAVLLHSRFLPARRSELEGHVVRHCGKEKQSGGYRRERAIVVATQVIEAGLDISFDVLFSEWAPIDSIVQRAGRVVRGGGVGDVILFSPEHDKPWLPYDEGLVDSTRVALCEGTVLDWDTERKLVNDVIGPFVARFLPRGAQALVRTLMDQSSFERDRRLAAKAVRVASACRLSIHGAPGTLGKYVRELDSISLHRGILSGAWREGALGRLLRVGVSWDPERERGANPKVSLTRVGSERDIVADAHYICCPTCAAHDHSEGLVIGQTGSDFPLSQGGRRSPIEPNHRRESWLKHATATAQWMHRHFLAPNERLWASVAAWFGVNLDDLATRLLTAAALHDIGKLARGWQTAVGNTTEEPVAHMDAPVNSRRPPHATLSSVLLHDALRGRDRLSEIVLLAVQHHHSVGARETAQGGYSMIHGWRELAAEVLRDLELPPLDLSHARDTSSATRTCPHTMPLFGAAKQHVTYCLVSRALRLSDWIASSGGDENAVLDYEDWFRNG